MRLPDEILTLIFAMVQTHGVQECPWTARVFSVRTIAPLTWMRIACVCSRWRVVALSSPLLWNKIALSSRFEPSGWDRGPYHSLFLTRSADAPLEVSISTVSGPSLQTKEVLAQFPRFRHLYLIGDEYSIDELNMLRQPAPQLRTLALVQCVQPASALLGAAERSTLRSLFIRLGCLRLELNCKALRQLHLASPWYRTTEEYHNLLHVLRQAQHLEDLKFSDTDFGISDDTRVVSEKSVVRLLRLKRLALSRVHRVDILLRWLCLPDGVCLSHLPAHDGRIMPADRTRLGDLRHIKSMTFVFRSYSGGPDDGSRMVYAVGDSSALQTVIIDSYPGADTLSWITDSVEELWLEGSLYIWLDFDIKALLECIPRLQRIVLTMDDEESLSRCLKILVVSKDSILLCPHLHSITICTPLQATYSPLAKVLISRRDAGSPIRHVRLHMHDRDGGLDEDQDLESAFRWWRTVGESGLQDMVEHVELVEDTPLPRMATVPSCHWRSNEAWDSEWPTWGRLEQLAPRPQI